MLGWGAGGFGSVALWQASQGLLKHVEVSPVKAGKVSKFRQGELYCGRQGIIGCRMAI